MRLAGNAQQEAKIASVEHREDGRWPQLFLETELLAIERDGGVEVVHEVADRSHLPHRWLLACLDPAPQRGRELWPRVDRHDRQTQRVEWITRHGSHLLRRPGAGRRGHGPAA